MRTSTQHQRDKDDPETPFADGTEIHHGIGGQDRMKILPTAMPTAEMNEFVSIWPTGSRLVRTRRQDGA